MTADPAVFHQAAERIRTGGHAKGSLCIDEHYCMLGALLPTALSSASGITERQEEIQLLGDMLGIISGMKGEVLRMIIKWNDAPERTPIDVITLLEQAEEKAAADLP